MASWGYIPSLNIYVDEVKQWLDAAMSDAEHVPHFSHESADSTAAVAVMALAPRALFKFGMDMARGSNIWPDLNNTFLRPLKYSACPFPLLDRPFPPLYRHPRSLPCFEAAGLAGTSSTTQDERVESALPSSSRSPTWPITISPQDQNMPQEVYQLICSHLSMEDVKALRLTSKEVNFFVAPILFESIVVPYHMGIFERANPSWTSASTKGKEKKVDADVFGSFGNIIKSFGIRFELPEAILAVPPEKHLLEPRESYWGHYDWPSPLYLRFDHLKDLEVAADEGFGLRKAFSELHQVEELAISVDNSLGWLAGPDKSIRDQVLNEREQIVKNKFKVPSRESRANQNLWELIETHHAPYTAHRSDLWCSSLHLVESDYSICCTDSSSDLPYFSRQLLWEALGNCMPYNKVPELNSGFIVVSQNTGKYEQIRSHPILPGYLSTRQIELLLENLWAQQAFLNSYIISVIDTLPPSTQVHTLNIARLPADYLQSFCRADFWEALPSLRTLKIFVVSQFREVYVNDFGDATTSYVQPSRSVPTFLHLLREYISRLPTLTQLSFGWASGGEHGKGIYGRNVHLLPAPFMSEVPSVLELGRTVIFDSVVTFPHVEHLHIKNCWATAETITSLVRFNGKHRLRELTLESVSLLGYRPPLAPFPLPPAPVTGTAVLVQPAAAPASVNVQVQASVAQGVSNAVAQSLVTVQSFGSVQANASGQGNVPGTNANPENQGIATNQHIPRVSRWPGRNLPRLLSFPPPTHQVVNVPGGVGAGPGPQVAAPPHPFLMHIQQFPPPPPAPSTEWRPGSWTRLLDTISPGRRMPNPLGIPGFPRRCEDLSLEQLNVVSSGYCFLYNYPNRFEDLDPSFKVPYTQTHLPKKQEDYVKHRAAALDSLMMPVFDPALAEIVQVLPLHERDVLDDVFQASLHWEDVGAAEAACFDHRCEGGTGRFSVVLRRGDEPETPRAGEMYN